MLRVVLAHHIEQRHALRIIVDGWQCVLLCHPGIADADVGVAIEAVVKAADASWTQGTPLSMSLPPVHGMDTL